MSLEIINVSEEQAGLKERTDENQHLKTLMQERDKRPEHLEQRVEVGAIFQNERPVQGLKFNGPT